MLFIGIDVASKKHDVIIISEHGEVLTDAFTIENSIGGFKKNSTWKSLPIWSRVIASI